MGKRYYCDYCERSFTDSAENRKKHINGVQHHRQRKLHYDSFRDAATILKEELNKQPCKHFMNMGFCEFGGSCRYSHLTKDVVYQLEQKAHQESLNNSGKKRNSLVEESVLEDWVDKVTKKVNNEQEKGPKSKELIALESSLSVVSWRLPKVLKNVPNLPPSLMPPNLEDFFEFSTWAS